MARVTRLPGQPAHARPPRPVQRMSADLIAAVASHLTSRDRAISEAVWEHRVLTTHQITRIYFDSARRAQRRLQILHELSVLTRFQPWTPTGSLPWHWVLGPAGAHVLAASRGITVKELGYRPDRAVSIAASPVLGHQLGVNDFFADLHAHARHRHDGSKVDQWWPEQRCLKVWKGLARPDAFGRWYETQPPAPLHPRQAAGQAADPARYPRSDSADDPENGTEDGSAGRPAVLDFLLEYDNGTTDLGTVAAKLDGYTALADATGVLVPLLFWLPSARREANLRARLGALRVPVATAVQTPPLTHPICPDDPGESEGPAGPLWLPVGSTGPRRRLATLAEAWGGHAPRIGHASPGGR